MAIHRRHQHPTPSPPKHPTTAGEESGVRPRRGAVPVALPHRDTPNNYNHHHSNHSKSCPSWFTQPTPNPKNPNSETKLAVNLPFQRQVCSNFPFHPNHQTLRKPPSHNPQTPIPAPFLTPHPESHHKTPQMRTCRARDRPAATSGKKRQKRQLPRPRNRPVAQHEPYDSTRVVEGPNPRDNRVGHSLSVTDSFQTRSNLSQFPT